MRQILLPFVIAITACSSAPFQNAPMETFASLILKGSTEALQPNRLGGIFAVDGHAVAARQRYELFLPSGNHKIAFLCPGWMYVDGFPSIRHKFIAGKKYELSCSTGAVKIGPLGGA
jgi:hypothetical protein